MKLVFIPFPRNVVHLSLTPLLLLYYFIVMHFFAGRTGTLMTAKKRGVVDYEGQLLFQGQNDEVEIYLLKTEIEDTPLPDHDKVQFSSISSSSSLSLLFSLSPSLLASFSFAFFSWHLTLVLQIAKPPPSKMGGAFGVIDTSKPDTCAECGKTVYMAERLGAGGKVYHKGKCFKCVTCGFALKETDYCSVNGKNYWCVFLWAWFFLSCVKALSSIILTKLLSSLMLIQQTSLHPNVPRKRWKLLSSRVPHIQSVSVCTLPSWIKLVLSIQRQFSFLSIYIGVCA